MGVCRGANATAGAADAQLSMQHSFVTAGCSRQAPHSHSCSQEAQANSLFCRQALLHAETGCSRQTARIPCCSQHQPQCRLIGQVHSAQMLVQGAPAVPTHNSALVAVLDGLLGHMQEPCGQLITVLIDMEVQVQIPFLCQGEHPTQDSQESPRSRCLATATPIASDMEASAGASLSTVGRFLKGLLPIGHKFSGVTSWCAGHHLRGPCGTLAVLFIISRPS